MAGTHALLSPSASERWSRCVGSIAASLDEPNLPNEDGASGTLTHQLSETCLSFGALPESFLGKEFEIEGFKFTVDQDRVNRVREYVEAIEREPGQIIGIEKVLDTSVIYGVPDQKGTADVIKADFENQVLSVHDLKDGAGIVYAKDNRQLLTYLAAARSYTYTHIPYQWKKPWLKLRVVIHQPRMDHYDEWTYTEKEVDDFIEMIRPLAQKAHYLTTAPKETIFEHLTPGSKQCLWCPIRGKCRKRTDEVLNLFPVEGEENDMSLLVLSDDEVAAARSRVDNIERWCRDISGEAIKRATAGHTIKGWKLAQGRQGIRFWKDPKKAESLISLMLTDEQMYEPREIISPTAAEKLLKKSYSAVADLVDRAPGSVTLVPEADARPVVTVTQVEFEMVK